jgi:hypothetical protein
MPLFLAVALLLGCDGHMKDLRADEPSAEEPERASPPACAVRPDETADLVKHSVYPITARIPHGWRATEARNEMIPCDSWILAPAGVDLIRDRDAPRVILCMGWLPRVSRHSAGFPGGRTEDARPEDLCVAGRRVSALAEDQARYLMADLDIGELAISVQALAPDRGGRQQVREVMRQLQVDSAARPEGTADRRRRAMDMALKYASERGLTEVRVSEILQDRDKKKLLMSIFHAKGLTVVWVDPVSGRVTEAR